MLRKLIGAALVLVFCVGVTMADEIRAVIIKVDGDKVTFAESKGKGEKGEEKTLPIAGDAKIYKGKFNADLKKVEADVLIEGGLKNEMFGKIGEKGLRATITTDKEKITQILVGGKGKGK